MPIGARRDHGATRAIACLAAAGLVLGAGSAFAAEQPPSPQSDDAALRAQVAQLTALVQAMSQRDQEQIKALSAQVAALQARLDATQPVATADQPTQGAKAPAQQGLPRTAQNSSEPKLLPTREARAEQETAEPRVVQNSTHRFEMESADGRYSIGLTGVLQLDAGGYLGFHPDSAAAGPQELSNGVNARRARIGIVGTADGDWGFALVWDAGNSSDETPKGLQTAQIVYNRVRGRAFEIGYSTAYFTLDWATSANDTMFLERASASKIATSFNTGDARFNFGARFFGDRYWFGTYLTGPEVGNSHTQTAESFGAFQRVAVQALSGQDYSLHLGVGVAELIQASNSGVNTPNTLSLSDQPELRIDPTNFLDTGTIGTSSNPVTSGYVLDLETAATYRNLFWQGEYYHYQVGRRGLPAADFNGAYGEVSWTLTGEAHAYNPQAASYFRIVPKNPFHLGQNGWGALELAARVSYIDLNSNFTPGVALSDNLAAVDGGKQYGYWLGVNWYPNVLVRFMLDFGHVQYEKANGVAAPGAPLGAPVGATINSVSLRAQIVY